MYKVCSFIFHHLIHLCWRLSFQNLNFANLRNSIGHRLCMYICTYTRASILSWELRISRDLSFSLLHLCTSVSGWPDWAIRSSQKCCATIFQSKDYVLNMTKNGSGIISSISWSVCEFFFWTLVKMYPSIPLKLLLEFISRTFLRNLQQLQKKYIRDIFHLRLSFILVD
jgi:hypothetical protein